MVQVDITWEYNNLSTPMELYELKGRQYLWKTESVNSMALAPVGQKIVNSTFVIEQGKVRRFALVMKNTTDKPIYFFAAPHSAKPAEHSLGFKFKCLCINHAYTINPGQVWYRVVELRISKGLTTKKLAISHMLSGLNEKQAQPFLMKKRATDF